ncbi:MAG: 30S ribosomal protein S20 [Opitutae bacterium]|nr:30S ribosomal protein S20 [Opitutae bacterium]MCD8298516.1 30S ribosomal protein S20 [Opitutae bacterium]
MANIKSAQKNIRKSAANAKRNRAVKSRVKSVAKAAKAAVASGKAEAVKAVAPVCASVFDKAAKSGVIHPNKAARMKSRLAKAVNAAAK